MRIAAPEEPYELVMMIETVERRPWNIEIWSTSGDTYGVRHEFNPEYKAFINQSNKGVNPEKYKRTLFGPGMLVKLTTIEYSLKQSPRSYWFWQIRQI